MIIPHQMKGKTVAILGLGRSGVATAKALLAAGADILLHDDDSKVLDSVVATLQASQPELPVHSQNWSPENWSPENWSPEHWSWNQISALVISPGIPHLYPQPHPVAAAASSHGVPVISDVELLMGAEPDARFIGITGTNGKSTTTALTTHLLNAAGIPAVMAGNIGTPVLALELPCLVQSSLEKDAGHRPVIVLELSSYQLETTPSLQLDAGALLNVTPDHLERHGDATTGWQGYLQAKARVPLAVKPGGVNLIGDDQGCRKIKHQLEASDPVFLCQTIKGDDSNISTAIALAAAMVADSNIFSPDALTAALDSFTGLPHRMQNCGRYGHCAIINDSKATNAEATAHALASIDPQAEIHWIAGGLGKAGATDDSDETASLKALKPMLGRITMAYLIGASATDFARQLEPHCPIKHCKTLKTATEAAFAAATASLQQTVLLLSPAAASFDQFDNFEHRGECFMALIRALTEQGMPAVQENTTANTTKPNNTAKVVQHV